MKGICDAMDYYFKEMMDSGEYGLFIWAEKTDYQSFYWTKLQKSKKDF